MKNTAINSLDYTGIVTISRYNGSKKIQLAQMQNEGGNALFNFLSDCLIGDFKNAELNRPNKIKLLKYVTEDDSGNPLEAPYHESKSGFIYLLSKPEKVYSDTKGIVRYSFKISSDMIESTTFDSIGLYTSGTNDTDIENWAAVVHNVDDKLQTQNISSTAISALIIDWELNISNKNKEIR